MVRHIPCGTFVNESERIACERLRAKLQGADGDWIIFPISIGIARLEDLPALAFAPDNLARGVPLRITPRTPTESAFWVVKPWDRFRLEPALPLAADGLERLHTHLHLTYRYAEGGTETLILGLEIFHLLLELKDGTQLSGVGKEGVFANLEIFTQRLASEDARELHGWHPSDEQGLFRVRVVPREGRQVLVRERERIMKRSVCIETSVVSYPGSGHALCTDEDYIMTIAAPPQDTFQRQTQSD